MPRPGRARGARPTRSPTTAVFGDKVIEMYNHPDDMPTFSDAPKKRPRHATRGAAAAERRQESSSIAANPLTRPSTRSLRVEPVPMKPPHRTRDSLAKSLKHHDCTVCFRRGIVWMLLKCIRCARCVHSYCLNPPQTKQPKRGVWTCDPCSRAPPTRKKQAGRVLKEAVENFPFLVPQRYLDTMTDTLALATTAEVGTAEDDKEDQQDLGHTAIVDQPDPDDSAENTVVLKVDGSDSELDDLRPLADIRDEVQRDVALVYDKPVDNANECSAGGPSHLSNGAPSVLVAAGRGDHTSSSPEIVPVGPSQEGPSRDTSSGSGTGGADVVRSGSGRGGRGSRRGRPPRTGKDRRDDDDGKPSSSSGKVFLKLRCRPPATVFKERAKHSMDEKAKAEMCKRLAKARAKKAELRAIAIAEKEERRTNAMREKAASGKAPVEKTATDNNVVTSKPATLLPDGGKAPVSQMVASVKDVGSTTASPKVGLSDIGAAVTQIAVMQGAVTPMAAASSQSCFGVGAASGATGPSPRSAFVSHVNNVGVIQNTNNTASGSPSNVTSPLGRKINRMTASDKPSGSNGRTVRRHDATSPIRRGFHQRETKLSPSDPFGTGKPKVDPVEVIEIRDNSPERSTFHLDQDGTIKTDSLAFGESLDTRTMRVENEKRVAQFAHASVAPRVVGSSVRAERSIQSPMHRQLNENEPSRDMHRINVDMGSGGNRDSASNCTPEQRTAAKIGSLFRPPGSNPKAISTNWQELKENRNEALFTLAKEQKGGIGKRRSSARISSGSLDKDGSIRSAKAQHRTNNVPESERKRIHITAMMASDRARGAAGPAVAEHPGSAARKGSISRLLIDPSAMDSTVAGNSPHESVGHGRAQQVFNMDQSTVTHADRRAAVSHDIGMSRRGESGTGYQSLSYGPEGPDFHGNRLHTPRASHVDLANTESRMGRRDPVLSGSPWEEVQEYDTHRAPSRAGPIPSSHSGSQSEPGSAAAARGLTSVQTLKKPKKRTTLATTIVPHTRRPPEVEPARVVEVVDPVTHERTPLGRSRPGWAGAKHSVGVSRRPGHSQSSYEYEELNNSVRPGYLDSTPTRNSRRDGNFEGHLIEPPAETLSFKKLPRNDRYTTGDARQGDAVQDVRRYPVAETGLSSAGAEDQYRNTNISLGTRSGGGVAQHVIESQNAQNLISPIRQGSQGVSSQGYPSPVFPGDYHRGPLDDNVRFAESRRLRRSAAPTLPTATRRFQYEQGRQLARFTNSASPSEQQQAYSAARRQRTQQRHSESGFTRTGSEWEVQRESHSNIGQPVTSYPSYSHQQAGGNTPTLNHRVIAQEGARPQLAPVVYESDSSMRNHVRNDISWGTSGISRMNETSQGPATQSNRPSVAQTYRDYPGSGEQDSNPFSRYRTVPQSRVVAASVDRRAVFDRSREFSRPPISRVRDDQATDAMESGHGSYVQDMANYGRASDFSDQRAHSTEIASSSAHVGGECEYIEGRAVAHSTQQAQPARTDPSLKNLLG